MAIKDIKGYKPHTEDKINTVNAIKDAENKLGIILDELLNNALEDKIGQSEESINEDLKTAAHLNIAKERLKEASMWACRAVFLPEEQY